jgi:UPF0755 protein
VPSGSNQALGPVKETIFVGNRKPRPDILIELVYAGNMRIWIGLGVTFGLVVWVLLDSFQFLVGPMVSGPSKPVVIEITRGQSAQDLLSLLVEKGLMEDPGKYALLARFRGHWKKLKAGEYEVRTDMSPVQLMEVLESGVGIRHALTLREGENVFEFAKKMEEQGLLSSSIFLDLIEMPQFIESLGLKETLERLEGYLFPDTYYFTKGTTERELIRKMVKRLDEHWTHLRVQGAAALGLDRFQVLTLASMIEKETGAPEERPLISSVFHNRLKKRMRLQSDPTTIYGIWHRFEGKIHRSDLFEETPYNTYKIPALPKGPIGNPGLASIDAALKPSTSDYLFFVSKNDGTHHFSRTLKEHNQGVATFQLDPKAREGKSWRDRLKAR